MVGVWQHFLASTARAEDGREAGSARRRLQNQLEACARAVTVSCRGC